MSSELEMNATEAKLKTRTVLDMKAKMMVVMAATMTMMKRTTVNEKWQGTDGNKW